MSAPVCASAEGSCRPEGRRLPVVVGVREAVEVAAVPLQLRRAPVVLPRPPLPASNMTYDAHSRIQGPRVLHPLRGVTIFPFGGDLMESFLTLIVKILLPRPRLLYGKEVALEGFFSTSLT